MRTREHGPVVVEARRVPVPARVVVPPSGVVGHEPRHVRRKLSAAFVVEGRRAGVTLVLPCPVLHDAIVATKRIILPWVFRYSTVGYGVGALVKPAAK
jgi:hypothetical protein